MRKRVSQIAAMKGKKKIVAVTAYDYTMTALCDDGVDILLVGDSAGMVMLGHQTTLHVTMDHMCMFTGAVNRARKEALIVADMPFLSCYSDDIAIKNAGRLVREGADAVKVEGNPMMVQALTEAQIPVMGHLGLQPQYAAIHSDFGVRGEDSQGAERLLEEATELQNVGAFCIVLEKVAHQTAKFVTRSLEIPTIGIGSGPDCDGQVLVIQDMLGMYPNKFKFVKKYATLSEDIRRAISTYRYEVENGIFPANEHTFSVRER